MFLDKLLPLPWRRRATTGRELWVSPSLLFLDHFSVFSLFFLSPFSFFLSFFALSFVLLLVVFLTRPSAFPFLLSSFSHSVHSLPLSPRYLLSTLSSLSFSSLFPIPLCHLSPQPLLIPFLSFYHFLLSLVLVHRHLSFNISPLFLCSFISLILSFFRFFPFLDIDFISFSFFRPFSLLLFLLLSVL